MKKTIAIFIVLMLSMSANSQRLEESFKGFHLGCQKVEAISALRTNGWEVESESNDFFGDTNQTSVSCKKRITGNIEESLSLFFYKNQLSTILIHYGSTTFDIHAMDIFFNQLKHKLEEKYEKTFCVSNNQGKKYSFLTESGIRVSIENNTGFIFVSAEHSEIGKQEISDSKKTTHDILDEF